MASAIDGVDNGTQRQPYNESEPGGEFEAYHHISTRKNTQDRKYRYKGTFKGAGMMGVFNAQDDDCGANKTKGEQGSYVN